MDQSNSSSPIANILTEEQKSNIFNELGLSQLSTEKKAALANQMIDSILVRVFSRISPSLTDQDLQTLNEVAKKDDSGLVSNELLLAKVPNLNEIVMEETEKFKIEMKQSMDALSAQLP